MSKTRKDLEEESEDVFGHRHSAVPWHGGPMTHLCHSLIAFFWNVTWKQTADTRVKWHSLRVFKALLHDCADNEMLLFYKLVFIGTWVHKLSGSERLILCHKVEYQVQVGGLPTTLRLRSVYRMGGTRKGREPIYSLFRWHRRGRSEGW